MCVVMITDHIRPASLTGTTEAMDSFATDVPTMASEEIRMEEGIMQAIMEVTGVDEMIITLSGGQPMATETMAATAVEELMIHPSEEQKVIGEIMTAVMVEI
jgi:hypothetical protein